MSAGNPRQIRIGKSVIGFMCYNPYPYKGMCVPILGETKQLESPTKQELTLQEQIDKAILIMREHSNF